MNHASVAFSFTILLAACGGKPAIEGARSSAPEPKTSTVGDTNSAQTRYAAGDYVIYRYSGAYVDEPVLLEERIDRVEGDRLWIHVTATREDDKREWVQVVTDTPENQANNVIDELYEIRDGESVKLDTEGHREIIRLYEWTLPPCQGGPEQVSKAERTVSVAGEALSCSCVTGVQQCVEEDYEMSACECPSFVWTHGSAQLSRIEDGHILWNVEVVEHGNRKAK